MMKGCWRGWAVALSTMAVGCAMVAGIDKDYHPLDEGEGSGASPDTWCSGEECMGVCTPGEKECLDNVPHSCDEFGQWQSEMACSAQAPVCNAGGVCEPPSCAGLSATCGPKGDESCCLSMAVPGGIYNRSNDPMYPATVSDFRLDRFEVTVGRFRRFVEAYPDNKPKDRAGEHPRITGSGWDPAWDVSLPAKQADLKAEVKCDQTYQTWTDTPGENENLPMTCMSWYVAFAFCAWDGGRLPTEAEWNYAAAGGDEQRKYPWGNEVPDAAHAVYDCTGDGSDPTSCAFTDILKVGSKPDGNGRWGQADLAGSMLEWNLDRYEEPYLVPCTDCANLKSTSTTRVIRGGGFDSDKEALVSDGHVGHEHDPALRGFDVARCARTP